MSLAGNPIEQVRLKVGDTSEPYFLEDTVYQYILDKNSNDIYHATVEALEAIVAQCAQLVDEKVGDEEAKWSTLFNKYRATLHDYKNNPSLVGEWLPYAGGISKADINKNNANTDANRASIQSGSFKNRNSSIWE